MNLIEILTTADKLANSVLWYTKDDEESSKIISINYMIDVASRMLKAKIEDHREPDLFSIVSAVIKVSVMFLAARDVKQQTEVHVKNLVSVPLKELAHLLQKEFPQEQMNLNGIDHL